MNVMIENLIFDFDDEIRENFLLFVNRIILAKNETELREAVGLRLSGRRSLPSVSGDMRLNAGKGNSKGFSKKSNVRKTSSPSSPSSSDW